MFCLSQAPFPNSGFVNGFGTAAHYKTGSNSLNIGRPFNRNRFVIFAFFFSSFYLAIEQCDVAVVASSLFCIVPSASPLLCLFFFFFSFLIFTNFLTLFFPLFYFNCKS